jgi:hypothetical protein
MAVSSTGTAGVGVPCPREVWRAALDGRRITVTVEPHTGSPVSISGDIIGRRKVGNHATTYVTIRFVPDGELAPVEIEAGKEAGEWTAFRAFHWTRQQTRNGDSDHVYQYVGEVTGVSIPGARWDADGASPEGVV